LLIVVEDHRVEGGIGDAVLDAIATTGDLIGRVEKLGVREMPGSATPMQLRAWAGIDADSIVTAARSALGR
jgi:transketolase